MKTYSAVIDQILSSREVKRCKHKANTGNMCFTIEVDNNVLISECRVFVNILKEVSDKTAHLFVFIHQGVFLAGGIFPKRAEEAVSKVKPVIIDEQS